MNYFERTITSHLRIRNGLEALKVNFLLSQMAIGMVKMFGVLFVYQLGRNFTQSLIFILVYYLFQRVVTLVSIPSVGGLVSKKGYRGVMVFGLIFLAMRFGILAITSTSRLWLLIVSAFFGGLSFSFYYLSFHALFLDDGDSSRVGEQIGMMEMLGRTSAIIAPFFAGLLIESFGFASMFSVVVLILLFSIFPLFTMKHHKRHEKSYSTSLVKKFININPKLTWSMLFWQITVGIQIFFWPIYLFLLINDYSIFGLVGSMVMLFNSMAVFFAGKLYDKKKYKKVFLGSAIMTSVGWVLRLMATVPVVAVVGDTISRIFSPPWWMKIRRLELAAGEKVDSLVFGAAHEFVVSFAYIIALGLGAFLLLVSNYSWASVLIFALVGVAISTYTVRNE